MNKKMWVMFFEKGIETLQTLLLSIDNHDMYEVI